MLRDFCAREAVVTIEGRRYVCRPPTVRSLALFVELFAFEVWALARAYYSDNREPEAEDREAMRGVLLGDARAAAVLETCVTLHAAAPGELAEILAASREKQDALARAVLSLCDVDRIAESLALRAIAETDPTSEAPKGETISEQELLCLLIAERFGCSPVDVTAWPYETFLTAGEALPRLWEMEAQRQVVAPHQAGQAKKPWLPIGAFGGGPTIARPKAKA